MASVHCATAARSPRVAMQEPPGSVVCHNVLKQVLVSRATRCGAMRHKMHGWHHEPQAQTLLEKALSCEQVQARGASDVADVIGCGSCCISLQGRVER